MQKITCPSCAHSFDIEGVIANDIKKQMAEDLAKQRQQLENEQRQKEEVLHRQMAEFEEKKRKENEIFVQRLEKAKQDQLSQLRSKVQDDYQKQLESQEKEILESKAKIKSLQDKELELVRMQRKMDETLHQKELEYERKMQDERRKLQEDISKQLHADLELKMMEKDKKLADQHKLIEELKRKSEQGSMQLQGEILELAIEEYLAAQYPYDTIEEIKKGAYGADVVQNVTNSLMQHCGKIVYESKRTKQFSREWVGKLKTDQRSVQADIAVLITEARPKEMERFGLMDGVWVCTYEEFKSLSLALRETLLRTYAARQSQENKGDKMEMLYSFLTSEEFKLQITGIVDGFQGMKNDLEREKRAMQKIWKAREKQLEMVISNTIDMYGSIKGIAGAAIPTIDTLELPDGEELT